MKIFPLGYTTTTTAIDNKYESKIEEKQIIENILFHNFLLYITFHSIINTVSYITVILLIK